MTERTKTLYAYRPKDNHSFMIVCDTPESAKYVAKGWFYYALGIIGPYDDAKLEKDLRDWELITLTVEEDE